LVIEETMILQNTASMGLDMKHSYIDKIISALGLITVPIFILVAVYFIVCTYIEDICSYFLGED